MSVKATLLLIAVLVCASTALLVSPRFHPENHFGRQLRPNTWMRFVYYHIILSKPLFQYFMIFSPCLIAFELTFCFQLELSNVTKAPIVYRVLSP